MKRFSLLSLVALVFAVAYACTDATAPANSHSLLTPNGAALDKFGEPPPPPVDAVVVVCTGAGCVALDGTYFSNGGTGATLTGAITASALGEGECAFPGPAWLKFDKKQPPQNFDVMVSANGGIKCSHQRASGHGTIEFGGVVVRLDRVLFFDNQPVCTEFCGSFTATTEPAGIAEGFVFDREFYDEVFCRGEGEGGERPICTPGER